mmetsp:Transcript_15424/g.31454  ORF Transcript_15424/g.31454 Transcript_15424/m.31454 type:complete len:110 (+) Transcript_15424:465-794(+)
MVCWFIVWGASERIRDMRYRSFDAAARIRGVSRWLLIGILSSFPSSAKGVGVDVRAVLRKLGVKEEAGGGNEEVEDGRGGGGGGYSEIASRTIDGVIPMGTAHIDLGSI